MNDGLVLALLAAAGGGGGGGESDFTTCQVTIQNTSEDDYRLIVAWVDKDNGMTDGSFIAEAVANTISVILYKGQAYATFPYGNVPPSSSISVTGDIYYSSEDDNFFISGDGTITID